MVDSDQVAGSTTAGLDDKLDLLDPPVPLAGDHLGKIQPCKAPATLERAGLPLRQQALIARTTVPLRAHDKLAVSLEGRPSQCVVIARLGQPVAHVGDGRMGDPRVSRAQRTIIDPQRLHYGGMVVRGEPELGAQTRLPGGRWPQWMAPGFWIPGKPARHLRCPARASSSRGGGSCPALASDT